MQRIPHSLTRVGAAAVGLGVLFLTRRMTSTWGTFNGEHEAVLPGDELIPDAVVATRGVTIAADPSDVWQWIAQIGQGQNVRAGDRIHLVKRLPVDVALVEAGRHLVLVTACGASTEAPSMVWAFVVLRLPDGRTRLLVRERCARRPLRWRVAAEAVQPLSFVMTAKMLRGVRDRVEHGL